MTEQKRATVIASYIALLNKGRTMETVSKFEKVSYNEYLTVMRSLLPSNWSEEEIRATWEELKLPERATEKSAGYDFYTPVGFSVTPGQQMLIPTGIRAKISDGWVLMCVPRSGLGFKYGMKLRNTVGIIDSDYYDSDNEGHIMLKISVDEPLDVEQGDRFAQGIFLPFGITEDDTATGKRNGGFGSTDADKEIPE